MIKNVIVTGESKSGKTSSIIMPMLYKLIKNNRSLLFIDKNYEYYNNYAEELKKEGYDIKILNFDNPIYSNCTNILEIPYNYYKNGDKDKAYELVSNMIKSLFSLSANGDPFWSMSAISLVRGYIFKLFEYADKEEINFLSVSRFLDILDSQDIKEIKEFLLKDVKSCAYRDLVSVLSAPYETKASIISVTRIAINDLINYENSLNVISNDGFKLNEFLETTDKTVINKKSALFIIPKLEDSKNLLVNMILSLAYEECKGHSWYFILDNIDMVKVENFKEMFMVSNYRNIYMVVGTRNLDRLCNLYGKEILEVADVKDSKDLKGNDMDKMNSEFKMLCASLKNSKDLPHLEKKEIIAFDLLDKMSK